MTKTERLHKLANRVRRDLLASEARAPKVDSRRTTRGRFEAAHDEWRRIVGLSVPIVGIYGRNQSARAAAYRWLAERESEAGTP